MLFDEAQQVPLAKIEVDKKLKYQEKPEKYLDHKEKILWNKSNRLVKVQS